MKILAAIMGTVVVLLPALHANAQFTGLKVADAKPGDVRVIATAAIRDPLNAVLKQAEAVIGKPIVAEYGSARGNLKDAILKGQDFEVALLLPDVDDEIQRAGKIAPDRFEIARVPVAFGFPGASGDASDDTMLQSIKDLLSTFGSGELPACGGPSDDRRCIEEQLLERFFLRPQP